MRTKQVPVHSRDHADTEYMLYVEMDRKEAELIGIKQTHPLTHSLAHRHSTLYIDQYRCCW